MWVLRRESKKRKGDDEQYRKKIVRVREGERNDGGLKEYLDDVYAKRTRSSIMRTDKTETVVTEAAQNETRVIF